MSKTRMGRVKRVITEAFTADPALRATAVEFASIAYPASEIEKHHLNAVNRALRSVAADLGLIRCRVGSLETGGWHHIWGCS